MAVQKRNTEMIDILSADFVRRKFPFSVNGSISGWMDLELNAVAGTTITLLGIATVGSIDLLRYSADAVTSGNDSASVDGMLAVNQSVNLYNVGGNTLQLRLTAAGNVEIQRTAGSVTFDVRLRLAWVVGYTLSSSQLTLLSNRIGIDNLDPQTLLHVGAPTTAPSSANTHVYAARAGQVAITARNTANSVEGRISATTSAFELASHTLHPLIFGVNSSERARITTTGRLGVGNTAPETTLHVGSGADAPGSTNTLIYASTTGATGIAARDSTNDVEVRMRANTSTTEVGAHTNHALLLMTNNAERLRIEAAGNLIQADGLRIETDQVRARDSGGLALYDDGGNGIFVEDGGEVGIGTTSPAALLHLRRDQNAQTEIRVENNSSGTSASTLFDIRNGALGTNDRALIGVTGTGYTAVTGWGDSAIVAAMSGLAGLRLAGVNGISFETGGIGSANQTMVLGTSGALLTAGSISAGGDTSGVSGAVTMSNQSNTAANSTGVGTVKMKGATSRDSVGFIKMYNGVTAIFLPYWTTITG